METLGDGSPVPVEVCANQIERRSTSAPRNFEYRLRCHQPPAYSRTAVKADADNLARLARRWSAQRSHCFGEGSPPVGVGLELIL